MVLPLIRHAGEGRASRGVRGWIPAFAGMTETSCRFVAWIVPAQLSNEHMKSTKFRVLTFRHLRDLRGAFDFPNFVTFVIKSKPQSATAFARVGAADKSAGFGMDHDHMCAAEALGIAANDLVSSAA